MSETIGFRPSAEDRRILEAVSRPGETTSDVLRRALRLLEHDAWLRQFKTDAEALSGEDVSGEADAW